MKTKVENHAKGYDTRLEASDWRYSASVVGLIRYFTYLDRIYGHSFYEEEEEAILYCSEDITEERYLEFAESFFEEDMHHRKVEKMLHKEDFNKEEIKQINEKLVANTVLKNFFEKNKFNGKNKKEILDIITLHRDQIIRDTYKYKENLYYNFANNNMLFKRELMPHCRLLGYCVDEGRKSKSISYQFDKKKFANKDEIEFDFIPFSFTNTREAIFINNNFSIVQLRQTSDRLADFIRAEMEAENENARAALFSAIVESADFIDFDVEVIIKSRDKNYFETMFIRKDAIKILKSINNKSIFAFSYKRGENNWINIQEEVLMHILNNILLDELIEMAIKDKQDKTKDKNKISYVIQNLIEINVKIKGGNQMTQDMKAAYACAKEVVKKFEGQNQVNKIDTYRQKLISAVVFHDYDRACQIFLQLSNYSGVSFGFTYSLFENFEEHKELAYTFINAMEKTRVGSEEK